MFAAIPLPIADAPQRAEAIAQLGQIDPELAPVDPTGLHCTLHFFGRLDPERQGLALRAVNAGAAAATATTVDVGGGGAFPGWSRPTVLWLGVADRVGGLAALHLSLGRALAEAGFAADARPFRPHCTVLRVRRPLAAASRSRLRSALDGPDLRALGVAVRALHLYETVTRPGRPAVYRSVARAPLRPMSPRTDGP